MNKHSTGLYKNLTPHLTCASGFACAFAPTGSVTAAAHSSIYLLITGRSSLCAAVLLLLLLLLSAVGAFTSILLD